MSTSSIIRIKRSAVAGSPSVLAAGELAYSALPDNGSNGGDRLYIGFGTETNGNSAQRIVIGGQYFTDLLDHNLGTLTASSAILVDSNKKIDEILVDNLSLDGNTLASTDTNGDILVTPAGTGKSIVTNLHINDGQTSIEDFIISTAQSNIDIQGTNNEIDVTPSFGSNGVLTFTASLADIFTANTFGSSTEVPVITVDSKGRIVSVTTETISTEVAVSGDTGTDSVSLLDDTLNFVSGSNAGISVDVTRSTSVVSVTVALDQDLSTGGSPTFDDLTLSGDAAVNGGDITTTNTTATVFNANATTLNIGNDATTVSIGASTGTTNVNNDLVVGGDLTVQGTLTSIETVNLQTDDPLVKFGAGNTADQLSIGFYGEYVTNGDTLKSGFFRDQVSKEYFLFKDLDANIQGNTINASTIDLADLNVANLAVETDLAVGNDITAIGDITGDQINATLFVGEIDGGTY